MGHDYLSFNGRSVHLHDTQTELVRYFFTQELNRAKPVDLNAEQRTINSLRTFVAAWQRVGPGVWINTDFSDFVREDPHCREILVTLFARVAHRVSLFDGAIPLSYLQEHLNSEVCHFVAGHSTTALSEALEKLSALLLD